MPHSPYWYKDALWLLNSGTGELWRVDPRLGSHEVICALPGFLRGLCFVGNYALIGLCQMRETNIFGGLQIQERYDRLLCGVAVVDILTGNTAGFLEFTSGCEELYGIQFLSNTLRPTILNAQDDAVRDAFTANFRWGLLRRSSLNYGKKLGAQKTVVFLALFLKTNRRDL